MTRSVKLMLIFCFVTAIGYAQTDTATNTAAADIFKRITSAIKDFKPDTTAPPDDKITKKIIELRNLKGGFNINEAIDFKIAEDRQKGELPSAELDKLSTFFKTGNGRKWLDNAVVWIYRRHFTYDELKQLVKFYKTSAGQKMAAEFPVIMMQSLAAAEMIKDQYAQQQKK
ncbi:MAG TPA: DUF2059 domain-containing protein [Chitinophagaceae bacterium]|nr:DUF2059 domain-containing protein [Chitinophagaceae bacterium]